MENRKAYSLCHDNITPSIRVSTAAIPNAHGFGHFWQIETWIFSDDCRQKNMQRTHGTVYSNGIDKFDYNGSARLCAKAEMAHAHIVDNLVALYGPKCNVCDRVYLPWQTFCECGVIISKPVDYDYQTID